MLLPHKNPLSTFFVFCWRRFYVVNPTNVGYDFSWESQGNPHPAWRCVTQRGMILAGKRGEMVFEYTPDDMEVAEVRLSCPFAYVFRFPKKVKVLFARLEWTSVGWDILRLAVPKERGAPVRRNEKLPIIRATRISRVLFGSAGPAWRSPARSLFIFSLCAASYCQTCTPRLPDLPLEEGRSKDNDDL